MNKRIGVEELTYGVHAKLRELGKLEEGISNMSRINYVKNNNVNNIDRMSMSKRYIDPQQATPYISNINNSNNNNNINNISNNNSNKNILISE